MAHWPHALLVALFGIAACGAVRSSGTSRRYLAAHDAADTTQAPFSGAVLADGTLYLSGQIGTDRERRVPDTVEAEARAVLDKVRATLEGAGMTMDDLVSVQIFCVDVKHYDAFGRVYRTYFKGPLPARSFIGSGTLLFDARFEVQGIAVKR